MSEFDIPTELKHLGVKVTKLLAISLLGLCFALAHKTLSQESSSPNFPPSKTQAAWLTNEVPLLGHIPQVVELTTTALQEQGWENLIALGFPVELISSAVNIQTPERSMSGTTLVYTDEGGNSYYVIITTGHGLNQTESALLFRRPPQLEPSGEAFLTKDNFGISKLDDINTGVDIGIIAIPINDPATLDLTILIPPQNALLIKQLYFGDPNPPVDSFYGIAFPSPNQDDRQFLPQPLEFSDQLPFVNGDKYKSLHSTTTLKGGSGTGIGFVNDYVFYYFGPIQQASAYAEAGSPLVCSLTPLSQIGEKNFWALVKLAISNAQDNQAHAAELRTTISAKQTEISELETLIPRQQTQISDILTQRAQTSTPQPSTPQP